MTVHDALDAADASVRLHAALTAGTRPDPACAGALIARCGVEPDFFVRDMLTWALTRLPRQVTVPLLLAELRAPGAQARSQALHTLSKIGGPGVWPALTAGLLQDPDDEVARAAWRTAVAVVPDDQRAALAAALVTQLGRGDRGTRLSLSRALVALADVVEPVLHTAMAGDDPVVRAHAQATVRLLHDPDAGVDDAARHEVTRQLALDHTRSC